MKKTKSRKILRKRGRPKINLITKDLEELEDKLPTKIVNMKQILYWMDLGATKAEIAGAQYVSVSTLGRRIIEETGITFEQLKEKVCGSLKINLRRNQFRMSEKNATMSIWLGKQWLSQSDSPLNNEDGKNRIEFFLEYVKNLPPGPKKKGSIGEGLISSQKEVDS